MTDVPIAIVGLAARLPGASDVDDFWSLLAEGRSGLRRLDEDDLRAAGVEEAVLTDPDYVPVVGQPAELDAFDADLFGLTAREADLTDPQLRLFLECAHAALESAGHDPRRDQDVGVFGGVGHNRYLAETVGDGAASGESAEGILAGLHNYPDYLSTLVSYKLDLRGPSATVLTACSSSSVAVHMAVAALRAGECGVALAGGSEIETYGRGYRWVPGGPYSRRGMCRPFDADADGTVFTTGSAVLALKPLDDALAAGDPVRAVIRGVAMRNDGAAKVGFSAPSESGQCETILRALGRSGIEPRDVGYVEGHGTGTALGDPIEFGALSRAFGGAGGEVDDPGWCGLGSVKGNVGHLAHAGGAASIIKTVLALENELIPATAHLERPNPRLGLDGSPFHLVSGPEPWRRDAARPRIGLVSSLGFGGTNVVAVVEEAPHRAPAARPVRPRLVVWSARDDEAEEAVRERLAGHLDEVARQADEPGRRRAAAASFAGVVDTLQLGRTAHPVRGALVAQSAEEAAALLRRRRPARASRASRTARPVVFMFPGQGSQHPGMAEGIYHTDAVFRAVLDQCYEQFAALGADVPRCTDVSEDVLRSTDVAQPALFAVQYALAQTWMSWGIEPSMVVGHSIGELVAAAVAGVVGLPDAAALVLARGRAMAAAEPGLMLAVGASGEEVAARLSGQLVVAAFNGARDCVVAGPAQEVQDLAGRLADDGAVATMLRTSHAFHSPSMAEAATEFRAAFANVGLNAPSIPLVSAALGRRVEVETLTSPDFWAGQLTTPVLFHDAMSAVLADGPTLLLETGPGRALTQMVVRHPAVVAGHHEVVPSLPRAGAEPADDVTSLAHALGRVWSDGHDVDWWSVRGDEPVDRAVVPGYPYRRRRHWLGRGARDLHGASTSGPVPTPAAPEEGPSSAPEGEPAGPLLTTLGWTQTAPTPQRAAEPDDGCTIALLPADESAARRVTTALQLAGHTVVPVRATEQYVDDGVRFGVRPGASEDLTRLARDVAARGRPVTTIVHARGTGREDDAGADPADGFWSTVDLVRATARLSRSGIPRLVVLTEESVDVTGSEPLRPERAMLDGLVRSWEAEDGGGHRMIDVGARTTPEHLAAELSALDGATTVCALRGGRRWARTEHRLALEGPAHGLRSGGVYVVTGGLGGIGLAVAAGMARTGTQPRLALLARRDPRETAPHGPAARRLGRALDELGELGAEVRVLTVDVADPRGVRRVLDTITARWGPVSGVLHLAGVAGDGMLLFRGRDRMEEVLRPKLTGTRTLERAFADRPDLDFFVASSSTAAVNGLVGGADYAAANAYLDAAIAQSGLARGRAVSVNLPGWDSVGMTAAVERPAPPAGHDSDAVHELTLSVASTPVADEHRVEGVPVLPGTALLDLVLQAVRGLQAGEGGPVRLRDVALLRPLELREARVVRVMVTPGGPSRTITLESGPAATEPGAREWTQHVTCRSEPAPGADEVADQVDVAELETAHPEQVDPVLLDGRADLFTVGPRWRCVERVGRDRPRDWRTQLLSLRLTDANRGDLSDWAFPPALLDRAVTSAQDPLRDDPAVPMSFDRVTVHVTATGSLPSRVLSLIERRDAAPGLLRADVLVLADDGRRLVELDGVTLRHTSSAAVTAPPEASTAGDGPRGGLDPAEGVRILLRLTAPGAPRAVVVRPATDESGAPPPMSTGADARAADPSTMPARVSSALRPTASGGGGGSADAADDDVAADLGAADDATVGDGTVRERLAALWASLLSPQATGVDENFFDLGGNSLSAIELVNHVNGEFGTELNVTVLFDAPTLRELGDLVEAARGS